MPSATKETEKSAADMILDGLRPIWPNLIKREYPHTYRYVAYTRRANRMLCECVRDGIAGMSHYYNGRGDIEFVTISKAQIFDRAFSGV